MPRPKGQTLTEQDIVETAIALLQVEGESAFGVNRVARELGVQPPSLYNHIAGNEALLQAVVIEGYRRAIDFVVQQVTEVDEPILALKMAVRALRRFACENPTLYAVATTYRFELDRPEFAQIIKQMLEFYTALLQPFGFSSDEIVHAIRMLHAAAHGFIQAEHVGLFVLPQSLDESYERMINTLIDGLMQQQNKRHHSEQQPK